MASVETVSKDSDYYVYLFRNPIDGNVFYIGKGRKSRIDNNTERNAKTLAKIEEIRAQKKEPIKEFLRYNLDDETAKMIEAAAIDLIGIPPLTNLIRGPGTKKHGEPNRMHIDGMGTNAIGEIIDPKDQANITERAILIRINQLYRYGMDADSLYDVTRGVWVIGPKRECAEYAFSVFKGIVVEVYEIKQWYKAGTQATLYKTRPDANELYTYDPQRWEFDGNIAKKEIRDKYVNKSVKHYLTANSQNPIKYVNC